MKRKSDINMPWDELRKARHLVRPKAMVSELPKAMKIIINEIRLLKHEIKRLGFNMDKQINKIKKDLNKGQKDTKKLLKMDKVQDKKLDKMKKKGC